MVNHPRRSKAATTSRLAKVALRADPIDHDHAYSALLADLQPAFEMSARGQTRLFTTDVVGLWEAYLNAFPKGKQRQIHDCNCCRRFIQTYGGLVAIAATGETWPVMWRANGVPDFYRKVFIKLYQHVNAAQVTGLFLTAEPLWGIPETTGKKGALWQHLSIKPAEHFVYPPKQVLEPHQAMAAAKENVNTVLFAMAEYGPKVLDEALRLFKAEALDRSEKFVGPVQWLRNLHNWPKGRENQTIRHNLIWRAVAHAPEGYCRIKSSVVGPLLDDIKAGVPFATIKRKHAEKLHPLQYQRPQAAPSEGNLRTAEALFEKLGLARSLERRFARLDDLPLVDALWVPRVLREGDDRPVARESIFGHLKTKRETSVPTVNLPTQTMTWDKFRRTVLTQSPDVIELLVPEFGPFMAFVTAVHEDAPPILKWDHEDERNPVSVYTYHGPKNASQWSLRAGSYVPINAIMAMPCMWGSRPQPYLGAGMIAILDGCVDTQRPGGCLFPETLRADLHAVRSTIEAYSKSATMAGREEASAAGYGIGTGVIGMTLSVKIGAAWTTYRIDRWD